MARENEAALPSEGSCCGAVSAGPSSDIQFNNGNIDSFENVYSNSVKSYPSNVVLPLHSYTNEYQVSSSGLSGVGNIGQLDIGNSSEACSSGNPFALQDFAGLLILFFILYNYCLHVGFVKIGTYRLCTYGMFQLKI